MVRLRENNFFTHKYDGDKFQFLYGSIERLRAMLSFISHRHFNSCMVRLRDINDGSIASQVDNFNSCMVRLRAEVNNFPLFFAYKFQFLYGSIESIKIGEMKEIEAKFQFLYGSIERCNSRRPASI